MLQSYYNSFFKDYSYINIKVIYLIISPKVFEMEGNHAPLAKPVSLSSYFSVLIY